MVTTVLAGRLMVQGTLTVTALTTSLLGLIVPLILQAILDPVRVTSSMAVHLA